MFAFVICAAVLFVTWYIFKQHLFYRLPPGPWGLPVVGHLPLLGPHPHVTFIEMKKKYGDVFRIRLGSFPAVVVNGVEPIRQSLMKSGDDLNGRPHFVSNIAVGDHLAFGLYRPSWKIHKKLATSTLLAFSHERSRKMQEIFQEEIVALIDDFSAKAGQPFDPKEDLYIASGSVPYKLCYGSGKEARESQPFRTLISTVQDFVKVAGAGNPVDVMPWLRVVMPEKVRSVYNFVESEFVIRNKLTNEHRETLQKGDLRDITDAILAVDYDAEELKSVGLTEETFLTTLDEYIAAALDTVGTAMGWLLLHMVLYPDIQERVHSEIIDIIGDSRLPRIEDRKALVFTEATIVENMRIKTPIPMSIPHSAIKDTKINGYDVPEDTVVLFNLYSLAHDPSVWGDPEAFRPERFVKPDGSFNAELANVTLPFSAGPRKCPGDILARNEMFIFFTALIQSFKFCPAQEFYDTEAVPGLTDAPKPHVLIAKRRN